MTKKRMTTAQPKAEIDQGMGMFEGMEQVHSEVLKQTRETRAEMYELAGRVCKLEDRTSRRTEAVKDFLARHWLLLIPLAGFGTTGALVNYYAPMYTPFLLGTLSTVIGTIGVGVWGSKTFD